MQTLSQESKASTRRGQRVDSARPRGGLVYGLILPHAAALLYEGAFRADAFHGEGAMAYANGDRYEGAWAAGWRCH
jgi:hypothetical protein